MKRLFFLLVIVLVTGIFFVNFTIERADAHKPGNHHKPKPTPKPSKCSAVEQQLDQCNADLNGCNDDLEECQSQPTQKFPGDGCSNPDGYGLSSHGIALSYTNNGDGTFTDNNTGLMWEIKDTSASGIHDFDRVFSWSVPPSTAPDGTLFTIFLNSLNNTCDGAGVTNCTDDSDCGASVCGFAGYRDWRIPNVKELQSLLDYCQLNPAYSAFGPVSNGSYWSSTTYPGALFVNAWLVTFGEGNVNFVGKNNTQRARAVRP